MKKLFFLTALTIFASAYANTYIKVDCANRDILSKHSYEASGQLIREVDGEITESIDVSIYHAAEKISGVELLVLKDNACVGLIKVKDAEDLELQDVLGQYSVTYHINAGFMMVPIDSFMDGRYKRMDSDVKLTAAPQNIKELLGHGFGGFGVTIKEVKYTYVIE